MHIYTLESTRTRFARALDSFIKTFIRNCAWADLWTKTDLFRYFSNHLSS